MVARTVTCGSCGAGTRIPDEDWDQQRDTVADWWDEHVRSGHPGEDRSAIIQQVTPNPFFEPNSLMGPLWG